MDLSKIKLEGIQIPSKDETLLNATIKKVVDERKVSPTKLEALEKAIRNELKYATLLENTSIKASDIDPFKKIAVISTVKIFQSKVIDKVASVQPIQSVADYIYYFDFTYADGYANENITAGTKLYEKRTATYGTKLEGQPARQVGLQVRNELVEAKLRPLNVSWSFEAFLKLSSIGGQEYATNILNNTMVNTVAKKLRDEIEIATIDAIVNSVPADNVVEFNVNTQADCQTMECQAKRFWKSVNEASSLVYRKHGVYPNVLIIGDKAKSYLEMLDRPILVYENDIAVGLGRLYLGTIENRFSVIYDPMVGDNAYVLYKEVEEEYGATVVYAPFIPLGLTEPFTNPATYETIRGIFSVDFVKVVKPQYIAEVKIIEQ